MGIKDGYSNIYFGVGPTLKRLAEIRRKYAEVVGKKMSLSSLVTSILRLHLGANSDAKIISNITESNN
jgi:hypothetical protein